MVSQFGLKYVPFARGGEGANLRKKPENAGSAIFVLTDANHGIACTELR